MGLKMMTAVATPGTPFPIPAGFTFASMYPATGATFTYSNTLATSGAIGVPFTFPNSGSTTWDEHTITATGGSVQISYALGN